MKATRDQARMDAERARAATETPDQGLTPAQLTRFTTVARRRIRGKDGEFRRDHLRVFAQRVEVAEHEVRIMGSHNELLRPATSSNGGERRSHFCSRVAGRSSDGDDRCAAGGQNAPVERFEGGTP